MLTAISASALAFERQNPGLVVKPFGSFLERASETAKTKMANYAT